MTLFLFNEATGVTIDSEIIYDRGVGGANGRSAAPETHSGGGTVLPFTRPPQDPDTEGLFSFPDEEERKEDGEG